MKEMLLALLLLIIGFVLLIKGADFFVDGSSSVAKRLKVSSMIIGLTIVAMVQVFQNVQLVLQLHLTIIML